MFGEMILRFGGEIGSLGREIKVWGMNFGVRTGKLVFGGAEMRVWSAKFGVGGIQLGVGCEIGGLRVKLEFGC